MTTVDYYTASNRDLNGLKGYYFQNQLPVNHCRRSLKRVPLIHAIEKGPAPDPHTGPIPSTTYSPPRRPADYPTLNAYLSAHTVPLYEDRWSEVRRTSSSSMIVPESRLLAEDPFLSESAGLRSGFNKRKRRFWTIKIWGFDSLPALQENRPILLFGTSRPLLHTFRCFVYHTLLRDAS